MLAIFPEILLSLMAFMILLVGVFSNRAYLSFYLSQLALLATALILAILLLKPYWLSSMPELLSAHFVMDPLALILKLVIIILVFFTFLYAVLYNRQRDIANNEFFVLGLLSTVGMMLLVSAQSLLMIFLGVELLSLPIYAMTAMRREQRLCVEAAMKYFVMGGLATAMLLYGFSMIFGATHSVAIHEIARQLAAMPADHRYLMIVGLVFSVVGLAFKLGVAPFHFWVPDVYQGAPTSATLFMATAPKIAAFGMAIRLLVEALPQLQIQWQEMLIILSILSMGIGNFAAIVQTNIKRLLAYSSIAHGGYALLGLITMTPRGYAAAMFYMITYALMTLAAFGSLLLLNRQGFELERIDDLKALNNRHPWLAFILLIVMFSLAGIPPLVGFIAKVGLLEALISVHQVWLAVLAILFAVVGAYYYLRVVKVMYFESVQTSAPLDKVEVSASSLIALSANGIIIVLLGIFPGALFALCQLAF